MASRITQVPVEVILSGDPNARITQVVLEAIVEAEPLPLLEGTGPTEEVGLSDDVSTPITGIPVNGPTDEVGLSDRQASCRTVDFIEAIGPTEEVGASDQQPIGAGLDYIAASAPQEGTNAVDLVADPPIAAGDGPLATSGAFFGVRPLLLVKIDLGTGTEYESDIPVAHPSWDYLPEIIQYGSVERAIPIPPGPPIVGGGQLELSDSPDPVTGVQRWRVNLDTVMPRRSTITFKSGFEGGRESLFPVPYIGELLSPTFPPDRVILPFRDRWQRWLQTQIPRIGTRQNFPNLPLGVDEFNFPIVFGCNTSPAANPQGVIRLQLCDTTTNDYAANQTISNAICAVYRKLPGAEVFTKVSCAEFSMVFGPRVIKGINYYLTFVRFASAQPEGTEIRADIDGVAVRGPWGPLDAISPTTIRNMVDHVINFLYYAFLVQPLQVEYNIQSFVTARDRYDELGLKFDGAIVTPMNFESALAQMMASANFWLFPDRFGRITFKTAA